MTRVTGLAGRARSASVAAGLAFQAAALAVGCSPGVPPPSTPAPSMDRPSAAIPGDLDVAFRIDLDAARRLLGPTVARSLQLDIVDAKADPATSTLVSDVLARARVVWIAFRPGHAAALTDNVLVARGELGDVEPRESPSSEWSAPVDLGAGFRLYERPPPARRSAPARLYARADDWLVFVSNAEVDAVERALELGSGDPHVDPPDRGIVSLSARVPPLLPLLTPSYPAFAEALEGASQLSGSVAADDRGLDATVEVAFAGAAAARTARDRVRLLVKVLSRAEGLFGKLARGVEANDVGAALVVRVVLDGPGFSEVLGCLSGDAPCRS